MSSRPSDLVTGLSLNILNAISDAVIGLDRAWRVVLINPAAERLFGYRADELLGQAVDLLLPPDFSLVQQHPSGHNTSPSFPLQTGDQLETTVRRKDGSSLRVEASVVGTSRDEPSVFVVVLRDVTPLRDSEERYRLLFESSHAVSSSLELPEVLARLQHLLAETLQIPGGIVFSYNEDRDQLCLELTWGLPADTLTEFRAFPAALFHSQPVIREGQTLLLGDFRQIASFVALGLDAARPEWQSYLCVPLLAGGAIQGALELFSRPPQVFSHREAVLFNAIGQQVGIAIQNARLFEEVSAGRERLHSLSHRLVEVQEMERRHIARELHDEIGQALTGLKFTLERSARASEKSAQGSLGEAQALVNMLVGRVRELSLDLRPAMLDDLGLLPALLWHIERYTAQTGVRVVFKHAGLEQRFPSEVETAAYRIVQEGLTNVARHAGVEEAALRLWVDQVTLNVQVADQGSGFDSAAALASGASSGLTGMIERAHLLGGRLEIDSKPGAGTLLSAELPLAGITPPAA